MPTVNINQAPVPVLSIDLEDFHEMGITDPTTTEVEEVISYLRNFYLYNGDFEETLKEAILHVQAKRDLF